MPATGKPPQHNETESPLFPKNGEVKLPKTLKKRCREKKTSLKKTGKTCEAVSEQETKTIQNRCDEKK